MFTVMRSFLGFVQKGVHPREVALAVLLGTLAGFVCGWNLTLACVLVLVLVLRAPVKVFLQTWGISAGLAWMLVPSVFRTGKYLLEQSMVGDWLAPHADNVWLALFDADRYTLVGGAMWGLGLGCPLAWIAAITTKALQQRISSLAAQVSAEKSGVKRACVKAICWMLLGGLKEDLKVPLKARLLRPMGAGMFVLVIAPAAVLGHRYMPEMITSSLLTTLSLANGAKDDAEKIELSLTDGLLTVHNLQIPDPDHLDQDRVRIQQLTAEVQPGRLLRGYVHLEKVLLEGIQENVARKSPAQPCAVSMPEFEFPSEEAEGETEKAPADGSWNLSEYIKDWDKIQHRLTQAKQVIQKIHQLSEACQGEEQPPEQVSATYLAMRSMRCTFGRKPMARVQVDMIRARKFADGTLGNDAVAELVNLTSSPAMTGKPTSLQFVAPKLGLRVAGNLNLHKTGAQHDLAVEARGMNMDRMLRMDKLSEQMSMSGGKMVVRGKGSMNLEQFQLALTASVADVQFKLGKQGRLLGISPELWNEGLQQLGTFKVQGSLDGSWTSPALHVNTQDLLAQLQQQLQAAGRLVLVKSIHEQIAKGEKLVQGGIEHLASQAQDTIDQAQEKVDQTVAQGQATIAQADQTARKGVQKVDDRMYQTEDDAHEAVAQQSHAAQMQIDRGKSVAGGLLDKYASPGGQNAVDQIMGQGFSQRVIDQGGQKAQNTVQATQQKADHGIEIAGDAARAPIERGSAWYDRTSDTVSENASSAGPKTVQFADQARTASQSGSAWSQDTTASAANFSRDQVDQRLTRQNDTVPPPTARRASDDAEWGSAEVQLSDGPEPRATAGAASREQRSIDQTQSNQTQSNQTQSRLVDRTQDPRFAPRTAVAQKPAPQRSAARAPANTAEYVVGGGHQQVLSPQPGQQVIANQARPYTSRDLYSEEPGSDPPPTLRNVVGPGAQAANGQTPYPQTSYGQSPPGAVASRQMDQGARAQGGGSSVGLRPDQRTATQHDGQAPNAPATSTTDNTDAGAKEGQQPGFFGRARSVVWPFGRGKSNEPPPETYETELNEQPEAQTAALPRNSLPTEPEQQTAEQKAWYQKMQFWR